MVQLKQFSYTDSSEPKVFQFHNGTIKTGTNCIKVIDDTEFQFHNGTIKTIF